MTIDRDNSDSNPKERAADGSAEKGDTADKSGEKNTAADENTEKQTQSTAATNPQTMTQIKEMFEELLRKSKEQDTFNHIVTSRLDSLTTTSWGRGARLSPRGTSRVIPTTLNFSTPKEAPRVRRLDLNAEPTPRSGGRDINKGKATISGSATTGVSAPPSGSASAGKSAPLVDLEDDAEEDNPDESNEPGKKVAGQTYYPEDMRYAIELAEEEENFCWERQRTAEEERLSWERQRPVKTRRGAPRAQQDELDEIRASMRRTAVDLKEMRTQMHRATSTTPEINQVLEEAQCTPFSARIS